MALRQHGVHLIGVLHDVRLGLEAVIDDLRWIVGEEGVVARRLAHYRLNRFAHGFQ